MTLAEFISRVRCSWSAETAHDPGIWSADNPSAGHCAVTSEAFRQTFGGDIVRGMAGETSHYWNRLHGAHIDITREQFADDQSIAITGFFDRVPSSPDFDRRFELFWRYFGDPSPALAIEAGTDETLQAAQPEGQERGPQGNAQRQSLSHKYSMKEEPYGN